MYRLSEYYCDHLNNERFFKLLDNAKAAVPNAFWNEKSSSEWVSRVSAIVYVIEQLFGEDE